MIDERQHDGEPVRVGLVGLGGHGRTIQYSAEEAAGVDVVAAFDVDQSQLDAAVERFGCDPASSYEALLQRGDLEAVVLVTPNQLHRPQAEAAFAAGLDVLLEKPIANTVADGQAIVQAAEEAGHVLMVGHNMRRHRTARAVREYLDEGRLGDVVSVEIHFSADNSQRLPEDAWRLRPDQCPLLPVMQLGIHAVDLVHYFFGPIDQVAARAQSVTTPPGVIDSVAATFAVADDGPLGTMVSNYCTQVHFGYRIAGTEASVQVVGHELWFRRAADVDMHGKGAAEEQDFSAHWRESYVRQMEAFARAVRAGADPETDGSAGLQALAVVEAMQRAAETRDWQDVPRFAPGRQHVRGG